jgi:peptide/nickel transport system substrate-binding protein
VAGSVDRRSFLVRGVGVAALAGTGGVLAACGGGSTGPGAKGSPGSPRRGGQVRIGVWTEDPSLNPANAPSWVSAAYYAAALYDPLAYVDVNGNVRPYLAESIEHDEDYSHWTVRLRSGVTFHDGSALDARTVVANLETALHAPTSAPAVLSNIAKVSAADERTVRYTMKTPWVAFERYLTGQLGLVAGMATVAGKEPTKAVGTGPFVLEKWTPRVGLSATRNPHYWRPGLPYLDRVAYRPVLDAQQMLNSVRADNLDIGITGSTIADLSRIRGDASIQYLDDSGVAVMEPHNVYWQLNLAAKPLDDIRVRRALANAFDQSRLYDAVFHRASSATGTRGGFTPVTSVFTPGSKYYSTTGYPARPNPGLARQLIADYTKEHGRPSITVTATTEPAELRALTLTKSMWEPLGIDVKIQQLDVGRLIANLVNGQFQVTYVDLGAAVDPDQNYVYWSPTLTTAIGKPSLNFSRHRDQRVEKALQEGRQNPDEAARIRAYQQVDRLLAENVVCVWMGRSLGASYARKNVGGMGRGTGPDGARGLPVPGVGGLGQFWVG